MKKILLTTFFLLCFQTKADVGNPVPIDGSRTRLSDSISCVHYVDRKSTVDRFLVMLPSAGSGKFLKKEKFHFQAMIKRDGPNGVVSIPLEGHFEVSIRGASRNTGADIDISGRISMINPFLNQVDILRQDSPGIYIDDFVYLKNRLRNTSIVDGFRFDYDKDQDLIAGGFFCAPNVRFKSVRSETQSFDRNDFDQILNGEVEN
jgi:hypothetical protein